MCLMKGFMVFVRSVFGSDFFLSPSIPFYFSAGQWNPISRRTSVSESLFHISES